MFFHNVPFSPGSGKPDLIGIFGGPVTLLWSCARCEGYAQKEEKCRATIYGRKCDFFCIYVPVMPIGRGTQKVAFLIAFHDLSFSFFRRLT
jgi:hypothetical protein